MSEPRILNTRTAHADPAGLVLHGANPRRGDLRAVVESFRANGFWGTVVVDERNGHVLAGNHRVLAARELGWPEIPVTYVRPDSDEHALRILLADNRTSDLGTYDSEALAQILDHLAGTDAGLAGTGYDKAAVDALVASLPVGGDGAAGSPPGNDPGAQLDRAEALREEYGVERGVLWRVGRHRVMCGDSYDEGHRARLTEGFAVDLLHTDPPYGINIVTPKAGGAAGKVGGAKPFGATRPTRRADKNGLLSVGATGNTSRKAGVGESDAPRGTVQAGPASRNQIVQANLYPVIEGDDRPFDPAFLLGLAPTLVLWGANYYAPALPPSSSWYVWDKREDITRNSFADCELAWSNHGGPARIFYHLWNGLHKGSQHGERRTHPTEKPVALFEHFGRTLAPEGVWLDLFAGTGAQVVAAQNAGATCLALEYEPLYVGVVLDRLSKMGLAPERVDA